MLTKRDLQGIRQRLGLTQVQFARLLDVKPATVARWEQGVHVPEPYAMRGLMRLARQLGESRRQTSPKTTKAVKATLRHEPETLVTTAAAARWLGISTYTLNEWARLGRLPSIQYSTRGRRYFRQVDLDTYRATHEHQGATRGA